MITDLPSTGREKIQEAAKQIALQIGSMIDQSIELTKESVKHMEEMIEYLRKNQEQFSKEDLSDFLFGISLWIGEYTIKEYGGQWKFENEGGTYLVEMLGGKEMKRIIFDPYNKVSKQFFEKEPITSVFVVFDKEFHNSK